MTRNSSALRKWVESPGWFWTFTVALVVCIAAYAANSLLADIQPGNLWGLTYGTAAAVFMVVAALYGGRRRAMKVVSKLRLGTAQSWAQFHIYGGALFLVLTLMHTGFRLPTGALEWGLWILSLWVGISGIVGVMLQKWIPKILASGLSVEALYERIPELISEIRGKSEELVATCAGPMQAFYKETIAPSLAGPQPRMIYYVDITGGIQARTRKFHYLRKVLSQPDQQKLASLEQFYRTKLELDAHYTLQGMLRWWLYLHVPLSIVLVVLLGVHLYAVFAY